MLHYADGEKRHILHLLIRRAIPLCPEPVPILSLGTHLCCVTSNRHNHPQYRVDSRQRRHWFALQAGAQLMAKEGNYAHVRLQVRSVDKAGVQSHYRTGRNVEHEIITIGKAGRTRHLGVAEARGKAMNPADHPHGRRRPFSH